MAEWPNNKGNGTSLGSYGFALQALSEGLANALRLGWISEDEAKAEFRANVRSIQNKEQRAREVASLREQADELEADE